MMATRQDIATAEDTANLIEAYADLLNEGGQDERVRDGYTNRISELVTVGLGRIADEANGDPNEIDEDTRERIERAADHAYAMAGLDGVPGR